MLINYDLVDKCELNIWDSRLLYVMLTVATFREEYIRRTACC